MYSIPRNSYEAREEMDSIENINAFLGMIGGTELKMRVANANPAAAIDNHKEQKLEKAKLDTETKGNGDNRDYIVASTQVEMETMLANKSTQTLQDSKFAAKRPTVPDWTKGLPEWDNSGLARAPKPPQQPKIFTSAQIEVRAALDKIKQEQEAKTMEDKVLAEFREKNAHLAEKPLKEKVRPETHTSSMFQHIADKFDSDTDKGNSDADEVEIVKEEIEVDDEDSAESSDTAPFPAYLDPSYAGQLTFYEHAMQDHHFHEQYLARKAALEAAGNDNMTPASSLWAQAEDFVPVTPHASASTGQLPMEEKDTLSAAQAQLASKVANLRGSSKAGESPTVVVICGTDSDAGIGGGENRENMKTFKSWGVPEARAENKRSCVRKVILSGLPLGTDLTQVQSLISGGAIDHFSLSPSGATAYVTFTTGDACDNFHAKYPNGIDFRVKGKSHTVFVDKSEPDILTGVLQGYLDCGATRCVRAVGADEEWGTGALYKMASQNKRKVETIVDTFRNGVRTILFRFASIDNAVKFRGFLTHDEDWEACNIQFGADPCETATGVHLE